MVCLHLLKRQQHPEPPLIKTPTNLRVGAGGITNNSVNLEWNYTAESGFESEPVSYDIYKDDVFHGSYDVKQATITDLTPDTNYLFTVTSKYKNNPSNVSQKSTTLPVKTEI